MKQKSGSLKISPQICKPLMRLTKKKRKKIQMTDIRNEIGDISTGKPQKDEGIPPKTQHT